MIDDNRFPGFGADFEEFLEGLGGPQTRSNQAKTGPADEGQESPEDPGDRRRVFVVHGRNAAAREAMFAFLRALDLRPIEWSEARSLTGQGSPYIGEVLDAGFQEAAATVVLLTGDDLAVLRWELWPDGEEKHAEPQPRANVLFEAGMAFALQPRQTILVEVGPLRRFSDVEGRHAIRIDNSAAKRKGLAQALRDAGCEVNTNGDDWLSAGDFESCVLKKPHVRPEKSSRKKAGPLSSEEWKLLRNLADQDPRSLGSYFAAKLLDTSTGKARYVLQRLAKRGLVLGRDTLTGTREYSITAEGRTLVFESDRDDE